MRELAKEGETIGKSLRSWQGGNLTKLPTHCAPETGKRIVRKSGRWREKALETRM
jgi:hypothetical protein